MKAAYGGQLVLLFLYDAGGEVDLKEARKQLGAPAAETAGPTKSAPSYVALPRPLSLPMGTREVATDQGPLQVGVEARVHGIGAVSVVLRIPFTVPDLAGVNALTFARPADGSTFESLARGVAQDVGDRLRPALVETYAATVEPETYLVVVLTQTPEPAQELLRAHRKTLAGLVTDERRPERLSDAEVEDNLRTWYQYYADDLVVVDWERALVVEPTGRFDDVLTVIEAANLQLLELRVYDRYLDDVLDRAYDDLTRFYGRGGLFRSARGVQEELSNSRIDLVRVTDAINNIGKIFGDYYLAKLHLGLAERFHLHEWETIVREKMATLNDLYVLASHEVEHRRGVLLEGMIVLLFVIDLVLLWLVSGG